MIDIENEVINIVSKSIRGKYSEAFVSGEYIKAPPKFPAISIEEMTNETFRNSLTTTNEENHAFVVYEINIYSNKKNGKKAECRAIARLVDEEFAKIGFTRMLYSPVPNLMDSTIYRVVLRYRAIVSKDKVIFRR